MVDDAGTVLPTPLAPARVLSIAHLAQIPEDEISL
jgi:hypothetical protein